MNITSSVRPVLLAAITVAVAATANAQQPDHEAAWCAHQVDKVIDQFDRAVAHNPAEVVVYGQSQLVDSVYNPCQTDTVPDPAQATTVTGFAWASSPQWAWKAAQKIEFVDGSGPTGDLVLIDTQTGFHNVRCADGRNYYSNWLQWVTGEAVSLNQCNTLGYEVDWEGSWCTFVVCNDTYCTFEANVAATVAEATAAGISCTAP